jgi:hypothetical protein
VTLRDRALSVVRAHSPAPDAVIETDAAALQAVLLGGRPRGAGIAIRGDERLARAVLAPMAGP